MQISTEKRKQPRFNGVFPVLLRIPGQRGEQPEPHTLADNVSQGGLYLQLPYALDAGTALCALIKFPSGAKLAVYGQVVRTEQKSQVLFGMAICFRRTRLLSSFAE
jgi:hypothetical protein